MNIVIHYEPLKVYSLLHNSLYMSTPCNINNISRTFQLFLFLELYIDEVFDFIKYSPTKKVFLRLFVFVSIGSFCSEKFTLYCAKRKGNRNLLSCTEDTRNGICNIFSLFWNLEIYEIFSFLLELFMMDLVLKVL